MAVLEGKVWRYGDNIDTDVIIPARYLNTFDPKELSKHCMVDIDPTFAENVKAGDIMVGGKNFGCGSSREHAPWALTDLGLRAIVSSEIADIFRGNSLKNGLLPIVLDEADVQELMQHPDDELTIDVAARELRTPAGKVYAFPLDGFSQTCLLEGVDQLGWLLARVDEIERYEAARAA